MSALYESDHDSDIQPTLYGLPPHVQFCKRCVISNQRPSSCSEYAHKANSKKETISFADGVCDACRVAEKKASIDWGKREFELRTLCDKYRRNDGGYDCIVPGSGGKDSFYQAHVLKTKYGMHPLTVTWAPHMPTDWGRANYQAWLEAGFDGIMVTPNPTVHRLLTRLAVENLFHPFQPFIIGQKFMAPKLAAQLGIPLVFYGENEAEYGNPMADVTKAQRDWKYYATSDPSEVFFGGVSVRDLYETYGLERHDLNQYMPADPARLEAAKVEVHYLGYYLRWHPQGAYYYACENSDWQCAPMRTPGTYSKYNSIDDKIDDFHYWTTYIKFGIGRATYDAAQEIRSGDITRDEGVALVKKFDGEWPERFADEVMQYLTINPRYMPKAAALLGPMTKQRMMMLTDRARSPHLWRVKDGSWELRHTVWGGDAV